MWETSLEISDYQSWGNVSAVRVEEFSPDWLAFMDSDSRNLLAAKMDEFLALSKKSTEMWILYGEDAPILFLGVVPYSLVGASTYIWAVPFVGLTRMHLKAIKRLIDLNVDRFFTLVAQVETGFSKGEVFASFFGFSPNHEERGMTIYVRECKW